MKKTNTSEAATASTSNNVKICQAVVKYDLLTDAAVIVL